MTGEADDAIHRAANNTLAAAGWSAGQIAALAPAGCPAHPFERAERNALRTLLQPANEGADLRPADPERIEFKGRLGNALAASGPIDAALLLDTLTERTAPGHRPARGLALAVGTLGQCVALAVAGPDDMEEAR